jgi:mannonate dehydratase
MPVYQLLGGKCRDGVAVYRHCDGREPAEVEERVRASMAEGYMYLRCQMGGYGGLSPTRHRPEGAQPGVYFDPDSYAQSIPRLFDHMRAHVGMDIELLHDIHERVAPLTAVRMAKALEPYRLFFLEDPFAPEDTPWFQQLRQQTSTPLAMGELFVNRHEWLPLVANRWIDFIRLHISAVGGLSMARKVAACCEFFNVRTAWHGPSNVSPVGHAVNMHLDLACYNFGIQEQHEFSPALRELFPGAPEIRGGYMYSNDRPGLGIDIDEKVAARFPYTSPGANRGTVRRLDGTIVRP